MAIQGFIITKIGFKLRYLKIKEFCQKHSVYFYSFHEIIFNFITFANNIDNFKCIHFFYTHISGCLIGSVNIDLFKHKYFLLTH